MLQNIMCSYIWKIGFILSIPIQVFNFGLKFEGRIDLGPKWDYVYKLSPINRDIFNKNEDQTFNDPNIIDVDEEHNDESESHDLEDIINKYNESSIDMPYFYKEKLQDHSLEIQHDFINKEVSVQNEQGKTLKHNNKKGINRHKIYHKSTKQYVGLRNTYLLDDNLNHNSNENHQFEDKNKMVNLFRTPENSNSNEQIHFKNTVTDIKRNNTKSVLRIKKKFDIQKLKDNAKIKEFILHIFKQSLKVFDKMKKLTNEVKVKRKIKSLKYSYVEKFSDFLKKTEDHKLKTKLANQNVILNSIDMSNNILKRLVNHLGGDINDGYNIKRNSGIVKIFEREIQKEKDIENKHACKKLSICRTNDEYSDFITKILDIILQTNRVKIKQAADALTEVIKTNDFTNIIDNENQNKLRKLMNNLETWDPFLIRSMFFILRKVIVHKNKPIAIMDASDINLANKTISFYNLIDILNKNMGNVENKKEWKDIIKKMEDWRDGKRSDVQTIIESIIRQMINELEKLDYEIRKNVNDIINILLRSQKVPKL